MSRLGRPRRRGEAGVAIFAVLVSLASARAMGAEPAPLFRSPESAFEYLYEVARTPRCVNCHGAKDGAGRLTPTIGEETNRTPHPLNVTERHDPRTSNPRVGITCTSCHGPENSQEFGGPPGVTDACLEWSMPLSGIMRLRPDMSRRELCTNWQTAIKEKVKAVQRCPEERRMTRTEFFIHHIGDDGLIAWAFNPGPGRTPAPGSLDLLKAAAKKWAPMLENDTWCNTIKENRP